MGWGRPNGMQENRQEDRSVARGGLGIWQGLQRGRHESLRG